MAYVAIPLSDIEAGKPVKEEIFDTIRANQEEFNTRITGVEQVSKIDVFNIRFGGDVSSYTATEIEGRVPVFRASVGAQIVGFTTVLLESSTSGTLEVEIDKSTDEGVNWTPLLNNPVELTGTAVGSVSGSVDWVDVASQSFAQNDLLRVRITSVQVDQGSFHLSIYGELS